MDVYLVTMLLADRAILKSFVFRAVLVDLHLSLRVTAFTFT